MAANDDIDPFLGYCAERPSVNLPALAHVNESEAGEAERRANSAEIRQAVEDLFATPREAAPGQSAKTDWRYRLGYIEGLKRRDQRIEEARRKTSGATG